MADLPANSDFTGASVTQGGFKTALDSMLTYLRDILGSTGTPAAARTALGLGALATRNDVLLDHVAAAAVEAIRGLGDSGRIAQMRSVVFSTDATTTSTSFVSTGWSTSFTTLYANSHILVHLVVPIFTVTASSGTRLGDLRLRNVSGVQDGAQSRLLAAGNASSAISCLTRFSVAAATARTIEAQFAAGAGTTVLANGGSAPATMTLMEVRP